MKMQFLPFRHLLIALVCIVSMSSCMVTQTNVGKYTEAKGTEYTYSKAKQMWICWGLVPVGRTHTETPADGNCQVITQMNALDGFLTYITAGFFGMQTIKVKAKR